MTCAFITAAILCVCGMEWKYYVYAVLVSIPPLYFLLFRTAWRVRRLLAFLNPTRDPQGAGFHILQSLIAVGTGGLRGQGFMEGKQKLFYLPEPHTDFIFAVISEELGLIGAVIFFVAFSVFCYRGLRAAWNTRDTLPGCSPSASRPWSAFRLFSTSAWCSDCCPPRAFPCRFLLRRLVADCHPGQHGRAAQHHAANGLTMKFYSQAEALAATSFRRWPWPRCCVPRSPGGLHGLRARTGEASRSGSWLSSAPGPHRPAQPCQHGHADTHPHWFAAGGVGGHAHSARAFEPRPSSEWVAMPRVRPRLRPCCYASPLSCLSPTSFPAMPTAPSPALRPTPPCTLRKPASGSVALR